MKHRYLISLFVITLGLVTAAAYAESTPFGVHEADAENAVVTKANDAANREQADYRQSAPLTEQGRNVPLISDKHAIAEHFN